MFNHGVSKLPEMVRQNTSGRYWCGRLLGEERLLISIESSNQGCYCYCHRQAGRMLLAVSRQIFLAVAITVVVTDMVAPNTLHPILACLCRIARKIAFASKRLAVSQVQLLCSVLCSCIHVCVFIINCFID